MVYHEAIVDIGSVDHFGYLWSQKLPEVGNFWNHKFMASETADYWGFMAQTSFLFIYL